MSRKKLKAGVKIRNYALQVHVAVSLKLVLQLDMDVLAMNIQIHWHSFVELDANYLIRQDVFIEGNASCLFSYKTYKIKSTNKESK
jgi:hypothetical protein